MKKLLIAILFLIIPSLSFAFQQPYQIHFVISDPTGSCPSGGSYFITQNVVTGNLKGCIGGLWGVIGSGGGTGLSSPCVSSGGTITGCTSISAGEGSTAGLLKLPEINANGNDYVGLGALDSLTATFILKFASGSPPGFLFFPTTSGSPASSTGTFYPPSGNATKVATMIGTPTPANLLTTDANGNISDSGTISPSASFHATYIPVSDTTNVACGNAGDTGCFLVTSRTPFGFTYTLPANRITTGHGEIVMACFSITTPAASGSNMEISVQLGGTNVHISGGGVPLANKTFNYTACGQWLIMGTAAAGAAAPVYVSMVGGPNTASTESWLSTGTSSPPVNLSTNGTLTLRFSALMSGTLNTGNKIWLGSVLIQDF